MLAFQSFISFISFITPSSAQPVNSTQHTATKFPRDHTAITSKMETKTTFFDLPKDIRERIYRLHLVHDEPLTLAKHEAAATHKEKKKNYKAQQYHWYLTKKNRRMPPLLAVSKKVEKETAKIYYGELQRPNTL